VKAIDFKGHQAEIIEDRCILCGHCTLACPQNAKIVHSELEEVKQLLAGTDKVIASVAPSFISSFGLTDFGVMKLALAKLGVEGVKPIAMNGIAECKAALTKLKFNKATENFFEGMACDGGCLNGPVCITHSPRNVVDVDKYGNEAQEKTIFNSVKLMETL